MTLLHGNSPNQWPWVPEKHWAPATRTDPLLMPESLAPMRCTAAAAASFHSLQLRSRSAVTAEAAAAEEAVVPSLSCSNGRKDNKP